MIEQKIEKIIVDAITTAINDDGIQVIGTWQKSTNVKSIEDSDSKGMIIVKARPRSYETPTIPYATITVEVNLLIRADVDFNGNDYLGITNKVQTVFQNWQKNIANCEVFNITNEFSPTGYQLDGGDCGIDKQDCIWTVQQNMTVYGIIK